MIDSFVVTWSLPGHIKCSSCAGPPTDLLHKGICEHNVLQLHPGNVAYLLYSNPLTPLYKTSTQNTVFSVSLSSPKTLKLCVCLAACRGGAVGGSKLNNKSTVSGSWYKESQAPQEATGTPAAINKQQKEYDVTGCQAVDAFTVITNLSLYD